jgi:hypothetical protein
MRVQSSRSLFFIKILAMDTHHFQVIGWKPPLLSLSGFPRLNKHLFVYRRACGISSGARGRKTKPEWNQGRQASTKQEALTREGGNPMTKRLIGRRSMIPSPRSCVIRLDHVTDSEIPWLNRERNGCDVARIARGMVPTRRALADPALMPWTLPAFYVRQNFDPLHEYPQAVSGGRFTFKIKEGA